MTFRYKIVEGETYPWWEFRFIKQEMLWYLAIVVGVFFIISCLYFLVKQFYGSKVYLGDEIDGNKSDVTKLTSKDVKKVKKKKVTRKVT